jgi:galactokinase
MNAVAAFFGKRVLRELPEEQLYARLDDVRKQTGDRAVERALHFYNENRRVDRLTAALNSGDFEELKNIIVESGRSSFMYNQNCFPAVHPTEQPVALALCLTEEWLRGKAGYRVHGGGFAGTIQVFLPDELVDEYTAKMRAVFGENSCYILSVRAHGGCEI